MMRIVRAATNSRNRTTTAATIAGTMVQRSPLRGYDRGDSAYLDYFHLRARIEDEFVLLRTGGPNLAADPDCADALVIDDLVDHDRGLADQRFGVGLHRIGIAHVTLGDRPTRHERSARSEEPT